MIPKPEIPRTSGLYLYDHISMPVLTELIRLEKIRYHITESIVQIPVWEVSYLGRMKQDMFQKQKISYREEVSDGLEHELDHLFLINL